MIDFMNDVLAAQKHIYAKTPSPELLDLIVAVQIAIFEAEDEDDERVDAIRNADELVQVGTLEWHSDAGTHVELNPITIANVEVGTPVYVVRKTPRNVGNDLDAIVRAAVDRVFPGATVTRTQ